MSDSLSLCLWPAAVHSRAWTTTALAVRWPPAGLLCTCPHRTTQPALLLEHTTLSLPSTREVTLNIPGREGIQKTTLDGPFPENKQGMEGKKLKNQLCFPLQGGRAEGQVGSGRAGPPHGKQQGCPRGDSSRELVRPLNHLQKVPHILLCTEQ